MKIAVLSTQNSWYLRDLRRAAGTRHDLAACDFRQISASIDMVHAPVSTNSTSGGSASGNNTPVAGNGHPSPMDWPCESSSEKARVAVRCGAWDLQDFDAVLVRTMPVGTLEQVVFRMDALAALQNCGVLVVNPAKVIECAVDKYLSASRLAEAGLRTPATVVCQSWETAMDAFFSLGEDVVVKPIFGGEGRGITRVTDPELASRAFRMLAQLEGVIFLQEYVPHHGFDIRLLVIGNEVFTMRRVNAGDWRTNISRGAKAECFVPTAQQLQMARTAATAVGAPILGVDLLPAADGRLLLLEVNAVPGWQAMSRACGIDIGKKVLAFLESAVGS